MPTREIAKTEWKTYFDDFSRNRQGEVVSVELIFSPQADPDYALERQPLVGLSYEDKGSDAGSILIIAGGETAQSVTYRVTSPVHVYHKNARGLISDEVNEDEVIEVTSTDDPHIVFLRFAPA